MAARPSTPAPRSRLASTVSAWSSAVCPVAASGAEGRPAGGPGPGLEVGAVGHLHPLGPERGPEPPGRRGHHARPRPPSRVGGRGRRAPRSPGTRPPRPGPAGPGSPAPPDTPHTRAAPGAREGAPARAGAPISGVGPAAGSRAGAGPVSPRVRAWRRHAEIHSDGLRISTREGSHSGPRQARSSSSGPPEPSTAAMNRSPSSYWRSLASMPMSCWSRRAGPRVCLRRCRSTSENRAGAGDGGGTGPVHGDVAVALQQAHQRLDPVEALQLLGRGHQAEGAAVPQRVAPGPDLLGHPAEGLGEPGRIAARASRSPPRPARRSSRASRGWR